MPTVVILLAVNVFALYVNPESSVTAPVAPYVYNNAPGVIKPVIFRFPIFAVSDTVTLVTDNVSLLNCTLDSIKLPVLSVDNSLPAVYLVVILPVIAASPVSRLVALNTPPEYVSELSPVIMPFVPM